LVCLFFCLLFALLYRQTSTTDQDKAAPDRRPPAESPRPEWFYVLTSPLPGGMPTQPPWVGLLQLQQNASSAVDKLPDPDPLAFLDKCLERCRREVQGASLTMHKHERVGGTLHPAELVEAHYKVKPHSVYMKWHKGARKADAVLYVEGQHNNQMLVLPSGVLR